MQKNHCVEYEEKNERADTTNKLNSEDLSCASWFQRASSSLRKMSMFFGGGPKNHHLSPIPWVNGRCKLALIQYICNTNVSCTQYRFVRELGWANSFLNVLFKTKTHVLKNVFLHLGFWINFLTIIFLGFLQHFLKTIIFLSAYKLCLSCFHDHDIASQKICYYTGWANKKFAFRESWNFYVSNWNVLIFLFSNNS